MTKKRDALKEKLAVWDRIQRGVASDEDHRLAFSWAEEFENATSQNELHYEKWMRANSDCLNAWSHFEFSPSNCSVPRPLLLLFAVVYGISQIENGGFHQLLTNDIGAMFPEIIEGLICLKMSDAVECLNQVRCMFGKQFPREPIPRRQYIANHSLDFEDLTQKFFKSFDQGDLDAKIGKFLDRHTNGATPD